MAEIILNESPENELDVSNQGNNETENLDEIQTASFLKVSELKLKCRARNLRLKEDDVIVAVDGEPFHGSILEFTTILSEEDKKTLLTIKRNEVFFEIITHGSLGSTFKFTKDEETIEIENSFKNHTIYPVDEYIIFEVLRDLKRKIDIIDTTKSSMTWLIPPFWLIQNKLWEVLLVTISVYLITLSVAWWMFVITWILLAIYFNKGQTTILRSFSIYRDKHFWLVLAGPNEEEIQKICRKLDPKCTFDYPLLPPIEEEIKSKSKRQFA